MNFKIHPYYEHDGIRTLKDSQVMDLYNRMVSDGTAPLVFATGDIKSANDFLLYMKRPDVLLYVLSVDDEVVGITWLDNLEHRRAYNHFCVFSNFWGENTVALGKATLFQLIHMKDEKGFVFDVFLGLAPAGNARAVKFAQACGGVKIGEIPYGLYDAASDTHIPAAMIYYTRETCDVSI